MCVTAGQGDAIGPIKQDSVALFCFFFPPHLKKILQESLHCTCKTSSHTLGVHWISCTVGSFLQFEGQRFISHIINVSKVCFAVMQVSGVSVNWTFTEVWKPQNLQLFEKISLDSKWQQHKWHNCAALNSLSAVAQAAVHLQLQPESHALSEAGASSGKSQSHALMIKNIKLSAAALNIICLHGSSQVSFDFSATARVSPSPLCDSLKHEWDESKVSVNKSSLIQTSFTFLIVRLSLACWAVQYQMLNHLAVITAGFSAPWSRWKRRIRYNSPGFQLGASITNQYSSNDKIQLHSVPLSSSFLIMSRTL